MNPMFGYVDCGVQQQYVELEQGGKYGLVPSTVAQANVEERIGSPEMFGGEEEQHLQKPSAEPTKDGEFVGERVWTAAV
ncbi:hypothetical protein BAE44_0025201 [Dichanthelium oligosanthes]|uniref:Uncharacterized protein n=1 Tax=Dichanthelium oligosanthes TaxID=888268 RepID=A0A1E5ULP3_9POAL|nr:hypothetical protein BAE44_0025201 [Dichanthelium oligosanthes]